jgi:hypothetical protein
MSEDLVYRLEKRAEIRRQISSRKSVQEGKPDRIADLLEEAAAEIEALRNSSQDVKVPERTKEEALEFIKNLMDGWQDLKKEYWENVIEAVKDKAPYDSGQGTHCFHNDYKVANGYTYRLIYEYSSYELPIDIRYKI